MPIQPHAHDAQRAAILRRVNLTLRGPVIEILSDLVPEVRALPKEQAMDLLLADLELLSRCFQQFNANPGHFRQLLVDKHKVPVDDAEALLECGRSLEQVVSMVVRTAAKRYFRKHLDNDPGATPRAKAAPIPKRGLLNRLRSLLTAMPDVKPHHPLTRGEQLYHEFQDYLRHDWQVPMIPEYSQLPPSTIRKLGEKILDYRLPEDIRRLRVNPDQPPAPTPLIEEKHEKDAGYQQPPGLADLAKNAERNAQGLAQLKDNDPELAHVDRRARMEDILSPDGRRLKAPAFTPYLLDPKIRSLIPGMEQLVRLNPIINGISGTAGKVLVMELGFRTDQLAVFLMTAHGTMGEKNFASVFGIPCRTDFIAKLCDKAKGKGIGHQSSLPEIVDFVTGAFNG